MDHYITQKYRSLAVASSLGDDMLLLKSFTGKEQVSRPFQFELELLSESKDIPFDEVIGTPMTVRLECQDNQTRYFNGIVSRFSHGEDQGRLYGYRATLVPWLWLLTRTTDCRIFQDMSSLDIVKKVFRDFGFSNLEERFHGSFPIRAYCVQYRETAFDFVSRLMEQDGIYYFFKHENGKHTLVLSDSPAAHQTVTSYEEVPYYPPDFDMPRKKDYLFNWSSTYEIQPGAYVLNDFNFKAPRKDLRTNAVFPRPHALSEFERYDYPGLYFERPPWRRLRPYPLR